MERLSAEYLTLAAEAQGERFDALLARSGLSDDELAAVTASAARGPLFAGLREAEARGLDIEAGLPLLVARKSLADAVDVATVLHGRVDRWSQASGGRRRHTRGLIAGLIPRAQGVTDPEMARALTERDHAMELHALSLAQEAIARRDGWVRSLGDPPSGAAKRERWLREVATIAAYRDRWNVGGQRPLGAVPDRENQEQSAQRKRAMAAGEWAKAISASMNTVGQQVVPGLELDIGTPRGSNSEEIGSGANRWRAPSLSSDHERYQLRSFQKRPSARVYDLAEGGASESLNAPRKCHIPE